MKRSSSAPRISVLMASEADVAVILSRGPSKQVQLIKWDLRRDQFKFGQWFKGRVYEDCCGLSPNGELLIYFAADFKSKLYSWTAISKPPFFTALALWPKGDCWPGGGYFLDDHRVIVNHPPGQAEIADGYRLEKLRVAGYLGWLGDDVPPRPIDPRKRWVKKKLLLLKMHPEKDFSLELSIGGDNAQGIPDRFRVLRGPREVLPSAVMDWADWDPKGDLLYAAEGKIFRCTPQFHGFREPVELLDLNGQKFRRVIAPAWAQRW